MPYVEHRGARVWWDSEGRGAPILLINGLSSPSDCWFRLVPALAVHHQVLTFDNRGVGRTGVPDGPYPVALMASDAVAVLDAAGIGAAHVLGISMGGLIAQELALSAPDRVRSLILVATHPGTPHAIEVDAEAVAALQAGASLPAEERMEAMSPFIYAATTPEHEIARDNAVRAATPTELAGYVNQLVGSLGWERLADLQALTVPTLVLHGADDRLVSPAHGRLLADAIPGSRLELLDGCSHQVFTDQQDAASALVLAFLAEHATSERGETAELVT